MLNIDYQWSIGQQLTKVDIQNCMTHEAGHAVGLEDLTRSGSIDLTMYKVMNVNEIKKRSLEAGDKAGAQFVCPKNAKPTVSITQPKDYDNMVAYSNNPIYAYVSVSQGSISQVQYNVTKTDYSYESSWTTMIYSAGQASGSWNPGSKTGYYYITVRAKSSFSIYGYDTVIVYCPGPT